jgi:hypothetical protein
MTFFRNKYFRLSSFCLIGLSLIFLALKISGEANDNFFGQKLDNSAVLSSSRLAKQKVSYPQKTETNKLHNSTLDSLNPIFNSYEEDSIKVLKEELISSKNIVVKTGPFSEINSSGSRETEFSGKVKNTENLLLIEFRKSPLNSKGYIMSNEKLVIYGFQFENFEVIKSGDTFFLKSEKETFKLNYTLDFKNMEIINDSDFLAKLN